MNLYELYDGDKFLGEYTAGQIEELTGCNKNYVASMASTESKIAKRYRVVRTGDRALCKKDLPLLIDFELMANKILRLCGR